MVPHVDPDPYGVDGDHVEVEVLFYKLPFHILSTLFLCLMNEAHRPTGPHNYGPVYDGGCIGLNLITEAVLASIFMTEAVLASIGIGEP